MVIQMLEAVKTSKDDIVYDSGLGRWQDSNRRGKAARRQVHRHRVQT
jgi:hypothetical protein